MLIQSINHSRKIKILNANKTRKKLIEIMFFTGDDWDLEEGICL
jgi:hypothetical protein